MSDMDLRGIVLSPGEHRFRSGERCLMEHITILTGEDYGDHPECVDFRLIRLGRYLNDHLPADLRQELVPAIPWLIGTRLDGHRRARERAVCSWLRAEVRDVERETAVHRFDEPGEYVSLADVVTVPVEVVGLAVGEEGFVAEAGDLLLNMQHATIDRRLPAGEAGMLVRRRWESALDLFLRLAVIGQLVPEEPAVRIAAHV